MERDRGGCQAYLNHPDPLLAKLVGNIRSPQCATLRSAKRSYTCMAQCQDNGKEIKAKTSDLFTEALPSLDDYFSTLKSCAEARDLACAKQVHLRMCENGIEDHPELGNHLVTVFVICGWRSQALFVFNRLYERNEVSWTTLIENCVDSMEFQDALCAYQQMIEDSVVFSKYTVVAALQACSGQKCLEMGYEIHAQAIKFGFCMIDFYMRSSLVYMYSKCSSNLEAQALIEKGPKRDIVSTTALMAGYVKQGASEEVLKCYDQMQNRGLAPAAPTFVCSLKAIVLLGAVEKGQQIHNEIVKAGFETNVFISSSLVDLYAKCGLLLEAQAVFDQQPDQDVVSWTALIAGYVEHGFGEQALHCLEKMESDGVPQNVVTFMFALKACGIVRAVSRFQEMHSNLMKAGHENHLLVGNTLVDTYARWGLLAEAWLVFNNLSDKDLAPWNALISGYTEQGLGEEALKCFHVLKDEGLFPDVVTFVNCLVSCGSIRSIDFGRELHLEIVKQGLETVLCIGSAVLDMYMKCQCIEEAWEAFCALPAKDSVSWTALIEGYAEAELYEEALDCMEQMQQEGVPFSSFTYASGLKASKGLWSIVEGKKLHAGIVKMGWNDDIVVGNSLVDMYASSGLFSEAEVVFQKLDISNDISWLVLMGGYGEYGFDDEVLDCFDMMRQEGVTFSAAACVLVLKACANLGAIDYGREMHRDIIQERLERDPFVNSSLVDMYSKCGFLGDALEVFSDIPVQDVVSWTALISGLVEGGFGLKALTYLEQMQLIGVLPNATTFVCGLKACGSIRDLDRGQKLHVDIMIEGYEGDDCVGSSLIDMYARCGSMVHAQEVFNEMPVKDVVAWTALLAGFNKQGLAEEALDCFQRMKSDVLPNAVTYVCSLKACGSLELIDKGREIHSEALEKGLEANHCLSNYLVDMYAKCGLLEEAAEVFDNLEVRQLMGWTALMAGHTKQNQTKEALDVLDRMLLDGGSLREEWLNVLSACNAVKTDLLMCFKLHKATLERGYDTKVLVRNHLEKMYADCGLFTGATDKSVTPPPQYASPEGALLAV